MSSLFGVSPGQRLGEDFAFSGTPYSSINNFDMNFLGLPVYRADTKQEYATDLLLFAGTSLSGGFYAGFRFVISELERD